MRVGIASDHGGFNLKEDLLGRLEAAGHDVVDFGAHSPSSAMTTPISSFPSRALYPPDRWSAGLRSAAAASAPKSAPTKFLAFAPASLGDHFSARQGVEDDQMNVLCMGGRTVDRKSHGS